MRPEPSAAGGRRAFWEKPTRAAISYWSKSWKKRRTMTSRSRSGSLATRPGRAKQVLRLLPGSRGGHQVAQAKVGFLAGRLVQRQLPTAGHRGQRLQDLLLTQVQLLGQLARTGCAIQALMQLLGNPGQPQGLFLEPGGGAPAAASWCHAGGV
jgi:hypothetical protein